MYVFEINCKPMAVIFEDFYIEYCRFVYLGHGAFSSKNQRKKLALKQTFELHSPYLSFKGQEGFLKTQKTRKNNLIIRLPA